MPLTFRNRKPAYLWAFAAIWWAMLVAMTLVLLRDGPPDGYSMPALVAILAVFWVVGAGFAGFAFSKPLYRVVVEPGTGLAITWRYPFRAVSKTLPASAAPMPEVVESKDSEGDPYFHARLTIPGELVVDIAEGHTRAACEQACRQFEAALRGPS